ncbi:MAG: hypothetical protein NTW86_21650, partial [Candidatus Sumerlaeota bacterium]|nr:hypothetical protein [Candidatus Sumerlaeota bacterium]
CSIAGHGANRGIPPEGGTPYSSGEKKGRGWRAEARKHAALIWTFVGAATVASVAGLAFNLFVLYPRWCGPYWEAGFGEALKAARANAAPGAPVVISGDIAMAPYLTLYYDGVSPDRLATEGWSALRADFPPPPADFDLRALWAELPKGATLVALPEEILNAFPIKIVTAPARTPAEAESLPETFAVYKKTG